MNTSEVAFFGGFLIFVLTLLALDLGIFNKRDHIVKPREAIGWTAVWITLAICFYFFLLHYGHLIHGIDTPEKLQAITTKYGQKIEVDAGSWEQTLHNYRSFVALQFLTGYVIEESLSIDNLFVILLVFVAFGVETRLYHRVLFWGILGAIVSRCLFIFAGAYLVAQFAWILYLFGVFLIYAGLKILISKEKEGQIDTEKHPIVRFASKYFAVYPHFVDNQFFVKQAGRWMVTPLFIVLLIIECTDVLFAVDSIPAIFSITRDPYTVFFSNIFAIMGLRSMFFLLANVMDKFHYFKIGLSILLIFIGLKLFFEHLLAQCGFNTMHTLSFILTVLIVSIVASLLFPKSKGL